jgi:type I restriction enzyme M protein
MTRLTQQQLEAHLWGAANILRGKTAGQDYKNYILSLMFFKRLCDQWHHEADEAITAQEKVQGRTFTDEQKAIFRKRERHRFTIPDGAHWRDLKGDATNLGEILTAAMKAVSNANDELRGVFTVDWNQPAPDGSGKPLIPNEVVHALITHFDEHNLSNQSVSPDILGRAYEYLIKQFADDAGAKAGEFFTPPEVVDTLVRILEPHEGDTIYDPTGGSGGMIVHCADYLREQGHHATACQYFMQEMNWGNAAIGKINSVLHGLEAKIEAGTSTISDPAFKEDGEVKKFSLVMANFPFSDEMWWLRPEQQTDDKKKKDKLKKDIFKEGYKDPHGRFGRGTPFPAPPASNGDYAFILHILASLTDTGRAGIVCPQGVLFRGQPEIEEETGEFDDDGNPKMKRRKADDEYKIRKALLDARLVDAVISLPLNIFYGAGVPACLVILKKQRPKRHREKVLLVYAARHFRELSAQNELRPQDVMRILVHYQAYGEADRVADLVNQHSTRMRGVITHREEDEVGRLMAEYEKQAAKLTELEQERADIEDKLEPVKKKADRKPLETELAKLAKPIEKLRAKLAERDERIAESRRRAEEDRADVSKVGAELTALYANPDELLKHTRVVGVDEIEENECNLNIPRYVDTFEPELRVEVKDALKALNSAEETLATSERELMQLLKKVGYVTE